MAELTQEGTYLLTYVARECSSGVSLSPARSLPYVVDNTAPEITGLLPGDLSNTIFPSGQPLEALITDSGGSNLDPATIVFALEDDRGNSSTPAAFWNAGLAKTSPLQFVAGILYRFSVRARDYAGNETVLEHGPLAEGGGFLPTNIVPQTSVADIPPTSCGVSSEVDLTTGMKRATCENVPLHLASAPVTVAGSRHAGRATITHDVGLESAMVSTNLYGARVAIPAYRAGDSAWATRTVGVPVWVEAATGEATLASVPATAELGTLVANVPATWNDATLEMAPVGTRDPRAHACADPATAQEPCSPDPVGGRWAAWDPPIIDVHVSACDSAVSHAEEVAIAPAMDRALSIQVDTARLSVDEVILYYALNGGPVEHLTAAGTGASSYSLVVPGASLPEGTRLSYGFVVRGSFADPKCSSRTVAVSPRFHGFESLATADTSRHSVLFDAVADAWAAATAQPGISSNSTAQEICSLFFASPTPCDLFPAEISATGPTRTVGSPAGLLPVIPESLAGGTCKKTLTLNEADAGYFYKEFPPPTEQRSSGGHAEIVADPDPTPGRNAVLVRGEASQAGWGFNNDDLADGSGRVGFAVGLFCKSGSCPRPMHVTVSMPYGGRGRPEADTSILSPIPPVWLGESWADADASIHKGHEIIGSEPNGDGGSVAFAGAHAAGDISINNPGDQTKSGTYSWTAAMGEAEYWFFYAQLRVTVKVHAAFNRGAHAKFDFHDPVRSSPLYLRTPSITFTITDSNCFA
ncbi:MAG: hypothetical protein HY775_08475 [Acidobacteria bacterium]|nr:hypothetical protein [Acidobacteriota bacterium]